MAVNWRCAVSGPEPETRTWAQGQAGSIGGACLICPPGSSGLVAPRGNAALVLGEV